MPKIRSAKFLIFLIVFINFLGYGIVFPILPLLTIEYGGNPLISGILIGIFSLMQVFAMPVMGRLSDRYGRKPMLLFSLWGTVVSFAIMGVTHSIFWLLIARIIDGISGGNLSIAQAYMADVTQKKDRAGGMGAIVAGITLGFIIGPIWGGFFGNLGLSIPFISATLLTLISIALTQFFLPESIPQKEITYEKKHFHFATFLSHNLRTPFLLFFSMNLLVFWAQSSIFSTFSLFGKDVLKLSLFGTSLIFAFGGVISSVIQGFAIGKVVKKVGEKRLYLYSAVVSSLGLFLMTSHAFILFFLGMTVYSIGSGFLVPLLQSFVSEASSEHEQGGNMGLLQSFGSVGRIIGPILAGLLYERSGPYSPAAVAAVLFFIIFLTSFRLKSLKAALPVR